jgi:hypothetical protein
MEKVYERHAIEPDNEPPIPRITSQMGGATEIFSLIDGLAYSSSGNSSVIS